MYNCIRENWRIFKKYFWDPGDLTKEEVQERELYYVNEWLIHKKYMDLTSEQYSALSLEIWALFVKIFFNRDDIYDDSVPSKFAERTLMNPLFIEDAGVKQVIILSRNISDGQKKSKVEFINKYFNHPKISYINVDRGQSKADVLKEHNLGFDVFIDDELPNIRDMAEKFRDNLEKREFIIPRYGYNKTMPKELKFLIEAKGGSVTYYEPFKK